MPTYSLPSAVSLPEPRHPRGRRRVVIVTNPGAETLEYIGPLQVFAEANFFLKRWGRVEIGYDIEVVSTQVGPVYDENGLRIVINKRYSDVSGPVDTLMFQAVDEQELCLQDKEFLSWVARMSSHVRRIASICVGTFILAEAGVLDGRRATTHWAACSDFARRYPNVTLDPNPIYIKDGNVYTSAGSTSGLDLAVALVEEDFGSELARVVAQGLVMYLRRPGTQAQFSVYMSARSPKERHMRELQDYVLKHLDADLSIGALAARACMSERNFCRVFVREFGAPPGRFVESLRLESARHLLEQTDIPIAQVAQRCGFRSADGLRMAFNTRFEVSPLGYRRSFGSALQ